MNCPTTTTSSSSTNKDFLAHFGPAVFRRAATKRYPFSVTKQTTMQQPPQRAFIRYDTISQMHGGMGTHSFGDLIELVRQGYKVAAIPYNEQKDVSVLSLPIFQHWVAIVPEGTVAELGVYFRYGFTLYRFT